MGLSHHLQKRLLWFLKYGEQNNYLDSNSPRGEFRQAFSCPVDIILLTV